MGFFDVLAPKEEAPPLDVAALFDAERGGPVEEGPHVFIATPAYNNPELAYLSSREAVIRDLTQSGVRVTLHTSSGDSLVTRGRHNLMFEFLCSPASHLLFWDSDIEVIDPVTVRQMLSTGHDVVGGACPFRDNSGRVVMNLLKEDRDRRKVDTDAFGCVKVSEIGTGFMLLSRASIERLCTLHPELFYRADVAAYAGKPMWALFDTVIENERYLSEDYFFCKLWREAGGSVYLLVSAEFRHYGKIGCEGSFIKSLNLRLVEP